MVDVTTQNQAKPGKGFAFVCYSHANGDVVTAEVNRLKEQGYEIWYDAHIPGGAEWNDELAQHIQECNWFLYFVSPESVSSQHCRAELNYAQQHGRRILAIEITPTQVPAGLQLMLNDRQILFRHKLSGQEFGQRLIESLEIKSDMVAAPTGRLVHSAAATTGYRNRLAFAVVTVFLIAVLAFVLIRFVKPPHLDFTERNWVFVGALQNLTEDTLIGEALETSLRIALEQSQYASVLPLAMVREAKSRMHLDPDAHLDRNTATELARRENVKVSILGNIAQLGDSYTISIEIIDAADGSNAWAGVSRADSIDQLLPAIDEISRQVRIQLGESLSSIEASSLSLAKVTTPNLEALRAYSLAEKSVASGDWEAGLELLQRALAIDPEFAMAHGKIAAIYIAWALQPERAFEHYELALENKSRLSLREQLYIEASSAWRKTPAEMRGAWKAMTVMFPNEAVGFNNLGEVLRRYYLDFEGAETEFRASSERRAPWRYMAFYNLGQSLLAQDRIEEALQELQTSFQMSGNPVKYVMADAYIVLRRYDEALQFISAANNTESPNLKRAAQTRHLGLYAVQGRISDALELATRMHQNANSPDQVSRIYAARVALHERGDDTEAFRAALSEDLAFELGELEKVSESKANPVLAHLAFLARIAVRSGAEDLADEAIVAVREGVPGNGFPVDQAWYELLEAELLLRQGAADQALERVWTSIDYAELFQAHEMLVRVYSELGQEKGRSVALTWMKDHQGRAFAEIIDGSYGSYGQLFNILDWARADRALNK